MFEYTEEQLLAAVSGGNEDNVRVAAQAIDFLTAPPERSALAVARVLLYPASHRTRGAIESLGGHRGNTAFDRWLRDTNEQKLYERAGLLNGWLMSAGALPTEYGFYPIFLYNRNYGSTREILHSLASANEPAPPYLGLFCLNLCRQVLRLTHTDIHHLVKAPFKAAAEVLSDLFANRRRFDEWMQIKRQPCAFYGGGPSNIVLGCYDGFLSQADSGFTAFNTNAGERYDIGGGFNTSEIERLSGESFISADIVSPDIRKYEPDIVIQQRDASGRIIAADEESRNAYLNRQQTIRYVPLDVFHDSLAAGGQSVAIISTGFITSTVRAPVAIPSLSRRIGAEKVLRSASLSIHAIVRILELVAQGKDVDLFTVMRATRRVLKYRTCLLQWRNGRLVTLLTVDDEHRLRRLSQIIDTMHLMVDPDASPFTRYR